MSTVLPTPTQAELDAALEREIDTAWRVYLRAIRIGDADDIHKAWQAMTGLVKQRSSRRIAEMEARLPEPWRS